MTTYKDAGVDGEKKNVLLKKVKQHITGTFDSRVMASDTLFKSLLFNASELKKYKEPMLAFNADGAGTKTVIAAMAGSWNGIGHDVVNHCINDILTMGAQPLCFADYIASDVLAPDFVEEIVKGVAECCKANGIVFVGGETAEMPGIYNKGKVDVAGFILGAVEKSAAIDGKAVAAGDTLIGLPSTGLHTNGYSLARKALFEDGKMTINDRMPQSTMTLGEALLAPHRNYLKTTMAILAKHSIKGITHITGGSFRKNIPRILPKGLGAAISRKSWQPPPIFELIRQKGAVPVDDLYNTFNMGIGYVYAVEKNDAQEIVRSLQKMNETPVIIGSIEKGEGIRYVD